MPCSGCGGRTKSLKVPSRITTVQSQASMPESDEFVLIVYTHPNKGAHPVIGASAFVDPIAGISMTRTREGYRINYGHQPGGGQVRFRVHRSDVKLNPHFVPAKSLEMRGVVAPPISTPPPQPSHNNEPPPLVSESLGQPSAKPPSAGVLEVMIEGQKEQVAVPNQGEQLPDALLDLQAIPGVGPAIAQSLTDQGIQKRTDVLALGIDGLAAFPGISRVKAEGIIAFVRDRQTTVLETMQESLDGGDGAMGGVLSLEDLQ